MFKLIGIILTLSGQPIASVEDEIKYPTKEACEAAIPQRVLDVDKVLDEAGLTGYSIRAKCVQ